MMQIAVTRVRIVMIVPLHCCCDENNNNEPQKILPGQVGFEQITGAGWRFHSVMRNCRSTRTRAMRRWNGFRETGRGKIIEARRDADLSLVTLGSMTYVRAPFIARTPSMLKFARGYPT